MFVDVLLSWDLWLNHVIESNTAYTRDGKPIYNHGQHELWNISGEPQTLINITLKFHFCLPKERNERKLCQRAREISPDIQSRYLLVMEFRFDGMLCSNLDKQ